MNRRKAREQAFCLLYSLQFNDTVPVVEAMNDAVEEIDFVDDDFFRLLVSGTTQHLGEIDAFIATHSHNWAKERISKVSMAILRLCVYEMRYCSDTATSVAINEAVELAKRYEGKEGASFVNGVLGGIAKQSPAESGTAAPEEEAQSK